MSAFHNFKHRVSTRLRRAAVSALPVLSALVLLFFVFLAWRDFRNPRVALVPEQPHSSGMVIYRTILDTFDIDRRVIHTSTEVLFSKNVSKSAVSRIITFPPAFYCQANDPFLVDLTNPSIFIDASHSRIIDLGNTYARGGLRTIQDVNSLGRCDPETQGSGFIRVPQSADNQTGEFSQLGSTQTDLVAVGDPRKFPFDEYLAVYRTSVSVLVQRSDAGYLGVLGLNQVDSRMPGFFVRYASAHELEAWSPGTSSEAHSQFVSYNEQMWAGKQVAVVLQRSLFFRAITVFLGLVACVYLAWFARTRRSEGWFPDALGFFLTVWAIRDALSVGAPRTPTLIDYAALCFYVAFVSLLLWKFAKKSS